MKARLTNTKNPVNVTLTPGEEEYLRWLAARSGPERAARALRPGLALPKADLQQLSEAAGGGDESR